jgi:hypothetical protein
MCRDCNYSETVTWKSVQYKNRALIAAGWNDKSHSVEQRRQDGRIGVVLIAAVARSALDIGR